MQMRLYAAESLYCFDAAADTPFDSRLSANSKSLGHDFVNETDCPHFHGKTTLHYCWSHVKWAKHKGESRTRYNIQLDYYVEPCMSLSISSPLWWGDVVVDGGKKCMYVCLGVCK